MVTSESLLTVEQAAQRLNVHPITVRRHLRNGLLRGVKRGHLWRVPESALQESVAKPSAEVPTEVPTDSPLRRALQLIEARDAKVGPVAVRADGDVVSDLRAVREAQTP